MKVEPAPSAPARPSGPTGRGSQRRCVQRARFLVLLPVLAAACDRDEDAVADRSARLDTRASMAGDQVEPAAVPAPVTRDCRALGGETRDVVRPECSPGWRGAQQDATDALSQAAARARARRGTILLQPATTYAYSRDWMLEGAWVDRNRPRPITLDGQGATLVTRRDVQIFIGTGDTFRDLDLHGPNFGRTGFSRIFGAQGVNGSSQDRWTLERVTINGFADNGVLAGDTRGVTIRDCQVSHNGATGLALFADGSDTTVTGCVLTHNGQDGVDSNHSRLRLVDNVASRNGWRGDGGDRSGLLIAGGTDILIQGNRAHENDEHGIYIQGHFAPIGTVVLRDNETVGNNRYGISFYGTVARAELQDNQASRNRAGCWNLPYRGVHPVRNTCR